jgi:cellulose synthase/poly-beta-1,6-N-acetylglucosamine synthase-like glycosyltransferase
MRVAAVIPALDEEACIATVVKEVLDHNPQATVFVVDNGSTDATAEAARAAGAQVVSEPRRGYGYACAAGVAAAGDVFDALVFLDGDGSNDARQMPTLLAPIACGYADVVLGSRGLGPAAHGALPPHQRLGNALTAALVRLLYGQRITDLPPFKAICQPVLAALGMREMTYGWTVEMIVKCAKRGCRIVEVPVTTRPRIGGQSKVSGTVKGTVLAAYYLLGITMKYAWRN